jgi:hypothetical protein
MACRTLIQSCAAVVILATAAACSNLSEPLCEPTNTLALTNASPQPSIAITSAQLASIGAIETPSGELHCTGTLISDRWVLTAKHCLISPSDTLAFRISAHDAEARVPIVRGFAHPTLDLLLAEIAPTDMSLDGRVESLQLWRDEAVVRGDRLVLAGYGDTEQGNSGALLFLEEAVVETSETIITVDGGDAHGACHGDSGGPLLGVDPNGMARVVGVLARGESSCVGRDDYVRLRSILAWIEDTQKAHERNPCGALTWEGTCQLGRATWCDVDRVEAIECTGKELCGWDVQQDGFRCVADTDDPCNGVGSSGVCEGSVLRTCERGVVKVTDCHACGLECEWSVEQAACE